MDETTIVPGDTETPAVEPVQAPEVVIPQTDPELVRKNQELFARAKKAEEEARTLKTNGGTAGIDLAKLEQKIEEKVNLKLKGYSPELIADIEKYAAGASVSLSEAANSPFIQMAVEAQQAKDRSLNNTPAPSSKIQVFNGKPVEQIFKEGTPEEKQAAFQARVGGKAKSNE